MTEGVALQKLQQGSEDALAWFIDRYTPYVCTVIRKIIGAAMSESDVEEVASDVFYILWTSAARVSRGSVRPYLGGVARNRAKQKLREQGRELTLDDDLIVVAETTPESELEEKERDRLVREAVLAMRHPDREIFLRYYYHCQSLAEISQEMDLPVSTVKSRLHRGREKLRTALTAEQNETGGS